jgi:catechol 2,3-dioxygenase-like lactoylglutathione lyase family enzyme
MSGNVHPTEQLVIEIVTRDIRLSVDFYRRLGFGLLRDSGNFVVLTWEDHQLFLVELSAFHAVAGAGLPAPPEFPSANVQVMVANVDDFWRRANHLGARVVVPIADRPYGLRDFMVADPDGFGVRFASRL